MNNLYGYELKKLLKNKILLITAGVMLLGVLAWGLLSALYPAQKEIGGERPSRYEFNQMKIEASEVISGRPIDDTMLTELAEAFHSDPNDYGKILRLEDIALLVGDVTDTMASDVIYGTDEDTFYSLLTDKLSMEHFDNLSAEEKEHWQSQAQTLLSTPLVYGGYHDGWSSFIAIIKILAYMEILFIAIALSTVFTMEQSRKTDALIFSSKLGKSKLYWAKLLAGITIGVGFSVLLVTASLGITAAVFGLNGFDAAIQFILLRPFLISIGQAALILIALSIVASLLISVAVMLLSEITKNSLVTISLIAGALIVTLFIKEMPDSNRFLYELWYLLPTNLVSLSGAFRYTLLSIGSLQLTTYQFAPMALVLVTIAFSIIGKLVYSKYQVDAR